MLLSRVSEILVILNLIISSSDIPGAINLEYSLYCSSVGVLQ